MGAAIPGLRGPFSPESQVRTVFICFGDLGWDRFRRCNAGGGRSEPGAGSIPAAAGGPRPRPEPPPVSRRSRSTVGSRLRAAALLAALPRGGIAAIGTCPETAGHLVPPPQRTAPSSGGAREWQRRLSNEKSPASPGPPMRLCQGKSETSGYKTNERISEAPAASQAPASPSLPR